MMGIMMSETCSAYKKYNKIIAGIHLVFYSSVYNIVICRCDKILVNVAAYVIVQ